MSSERPVRPNLIFIAVLLATVLILGMDRVGLAPALRPLATLFYSWAVILAAFALLLGVINVVWVHVQRIVMGRPDWALSAVLVAALSAVATAGLLAEQGAQSPLLTWVFEHVVAPGQSTMFALLAFFMAAAAYRFLRIGRRGVGWLLVGLLLVLAVQMPATGSVLPNGLHLLANWLVDVPGMATLRGVLLGGAFALIVTAIRYLIAMR
jgi:hypothetical protein